MENQFHLRSSESKFIILSPILPEFNSKLKNSAGVFSTYDLDLFAPTSDQLSRLPYDFLTPSIQFSDL